MRFKEGDKVEFIYLGELKQGVVTEIRASNFDISYQVKTEFTGTLWVTERDLVAPAPVLKVPQFVADWISRRRQEGYNLIWSISYENNDMPDEVYEWLTSTADNQELFARAWLDGYEVEKEPLYYVKLPISKRNEATDELEVINMCLLLNIQSRETCISGNYRWVDKIKRTDWRTKLTEAQIKDMPGGDIYWQFAVLVEEVEAEA
ncbi:DUF1642 domain-containing protein [Listeria monocytogenes]|uniref:DUF1642 domain-containing protein n=1 Tax=Listeria monocytogenes TaxID=1639 RepID=UPI00085CA754|nr:DUF1642 domain-containing protein [Listeria monocytogenes]EDF4888393.1 DUF1642 domain-containing protein [Listeria monocytogenes]EDI8768619.1 DUF1642 domain-containing protein [Listeria monocytogenes]EGC2948542.1 DUF1642 domain-containing protein [Listeria monocytogenes]EGC2971767.1 DUF1642 domain-containing protein [Listeria monocytogenes]EGC2974652.1 DUF1642 domain-containing protein [Listeria monocytogenes]